MLRPFKNDAQHGPNGSTIIRSALQSRDRLSWTNIARTDIIRLHDHLCNLALLVAYTEAPPIVADIYDLRRMLRVVSEPFSGHDAEASNAGWRFDKWIPVVYPRLWEPHLDITPKP